MNVVGIVSEYNPFHNGHLYQLDTIKKSLRPDAIITVMSGNFVQRGEPAVFDKWARTEMALAQGIDLVIELPVCFSTATAEIFAESAIRLLQSCKIVNILSFGVEDCDTKKLVQIGETLSAEPKLFKQFINEYLKSGLSFPTAREKALIKYVLAENVNIDIDSVSVLLKKPNYILAIEYIKAINKLGADFSIFPVARKGSDYNNRSLAGKYSSASAIREALSKETAFSTSEIAESLPVSTVEIIEREIKSGRFPVFLRDFEDIIFYNLRRMAAKELKNYFDVEEGLENRIKKAAKVCGNLKQLILQIRSKRYPLTRIQRILIHSMLDIPQNMVSKRSPEYLRILGFTSKGALLLKDIKAKAALPVIIRASEYKKLNPLARAMFEKDMLATDIYVLSHENTSSRKAASDFSRKVIYFNSFR